MVTLTNAGLHGLTLLLAIAFQSTDLLEPWAKFREPAIAKWEKEVSQLEKLDQQPDPAKAILFIGSSSIRLWETMADDMAPWPTVRRGYGGAKLTDLIFFVERLCAKHDYRALAVFVANDISGSDEDRTPEEVRDLYKTLVALVRQKNPEKPIFLIAITPTSKRFHVWEKINRANELIKGFCQSDPKLHFVDTREHYLNVDGRPRDELFIEDKLHQNRDGYQLWSRLIKQQLVDSLGNPTGN